MPCRVVIGLLVLIIGSGPVAAQDDEKQRAAAHFATAEKAERAGDWQTAYDEYERAYAAVPHPDVLYNMASVSDRLGELQRAVELYRRYLDESEPRPTDAPQVERSIRDLERRIEAQPEPAPRPTGPPNRLRRDGRRPPPSMTVDRNDAVVVGPPTKRSAWRLGASYGIGVGDVPVERYLLVGSYALIKVRLQADFAAGFMGRNDRGIGVGGRYWLAFDHWRPFVRVLGTIGYAPKDASSDAESVFPKSVELGVGVAWAARHGEAYVVAGPRYSFGGVTADDTLSDSHINDEKAVTLDFGFVFGSRDDTVEPLISVRR